MIGKAIYKPTSKASVLPESAESLAPPILVPGTTPPSVAAFISSSDASHDFIFSSKLTVVGVVVEDDDSVVSSAIDSGLNLLIDKVEILDDVGDIKAVVEKICSMITATVNRTVEQIMIRMYNS